MKTIMILWNTKENMKFDVRVQKEMRALVDAGIRVEILVLGNAFYTEIQNDGIIVTEIDTHTILPDEYNHYLVLKHKNIIKRNITRVVRRFTDLIIQMRMRKYILEQSFEVLHCHDYNTLMMSAVKKQKPSLCIIYDSHELHSEYGYNGTLKAKIHKAIVILNERRWMKNVDWAITVNEYLRDVLSKLYNIPKIDIVQNIAERYETDTSINIYKDYSISSDKKLVIYQGGIIKNKGISEMIAALSKLRDDICLLIAGSGEMLNEVKSAESKCDKIRYLGRLERNELYNYIKQCQIGLCIIKNAHDSYYYSSPNKMWDYLVNGVPCIASDFPYISKIIREFNVGILINPDSVEDLVTALNYYLDDVNKEELLEMRRNAIQLGNKVNWDVEKKKLVNIYNSLIGNKG